MLGVGPQRSWGELTPQQIGGDHLEYTCGLPAYVYSMAARQDKDSPFQHFDAFYHDLDLGAKPDFAHEIECGKDVACQAHWLPRLLGNVEGMQQAWSSMLEQTALARATAPSQTQLDLMAVKAVEQIMRDDCGGRRSMTPAPGRILLFGMGSCKTFKTDMVVTQAEGLPIQGHPHVAAAMATACTAKHEIVLGLQDGSERRVPCAQAYQGPAQFFAADIGKVLAKLDQ
jgi:hypothetical protein